MKAPNLKKVPVSGSKPRSNFDLSHKKKLDTQFGALYPVLCQPVMPGDEFSYSYEYLLRFPAFVSQVYQSYVVQTDFFFVPNHLIWSKFPSFMSAGFDGKTEIRHPYIEFNTLNEYARGMSLDPHGSLFDALGLPQSLITSETDGRNINPFAMFAYYRVIIDYYTGVDTNLNALRQQVYDRVSMIPGTVSGDVSSILWDFATQISRYGVDDTGSQPDPFGLFHRLYPIDYFTGARSNPQLGPAMTIPISLINNDYNVFELLNPDSSFSNTPLQATYNSDQNRLHVYPQGKSGNAVVLNGDVIGNTATINDFYSAARLQELLNLYGYTGFTPEDRVAAEFGVKNPDTRNFRSEHIFTDYHDVQVGEVFSSDVNVDATSQNQMIAGVGTAIGKDFASSRGFRWKNNSPSYGFLIGFVSCYPEAAYSQGLPRHFQMLDRFDYPHPNLSELGLQAIKRSEIFYEDNSDSNDEEFAYVPRYADYKTALNTVHGALKDSLNYLTSSRLFSSKPEFNERFLHVIPGLNGLNRTFNTVMYGKEINPLFFDFKHRITAMRDLPYYGLPKY